MKKFEKLRKAILEEQKKMNLRYKPGMNYYDDEARNPKKFNYNPQQHWRKQDDPPHQPQPRDVRMNSLSLLGLYTLFFFGATGYIMYTIRKGNSNTIVRTQGETVRTRFKNDDDELTEKELHDRYFEDIRKKQKSYNNENDQ